MLSLKCVDWNLISIYNESEVEMAYCEGSQVTYFSCGHWAGDDNGIFYGVFTSRMCPQCQRKIDKGKTLKPLKYPHTYPPKYHIKIK